MEKKTMDSLTDIPEGNNSVGALKDVLLGSGVASLEYKLRINRKKSDNPHPKLKNSH
jgi:hypothetical protein